jgi:hypothetical protein
MKEGNLTVLYTKETRCHGRISDGKRDVGTVAGRIGYRAINV